MSKTSIFVNLPVKNVQSSIDFFKRIGYSFNPQFTNEKGACMIIEENIFAMLLDEEFFKSFTKKPITDVATSTEVIIALSADSKEKVAELVDLAFAAGAGVYNEPDDQGFMYSRSFKDLDGHLWEVVYMDPTYVIDQDAN
ncbi:MAG: hypothetical protein H7X94_06685 [Vallitaleaceae bacterium]|nr:hypothetical protein [Vallitaleaceae bacterium]